MLTFIHSKLKEGRNVFFKAFKMIKGKYLSMPVFLIIFSLYGGFIHVEDTIADNCVGSECIPHCFPLVTGLSVEVLEVYEGDSVKVCIQSSGQGWSVFQVPDCINFKVLVYAEGTGLLYDTCGCGGPKPKSYEENGCYECSGKCIKVFHNVGESIDFWAENHAAGGESCTGYCYCSYDTITVSIPAESPDTTDIDSTIASELGPPEICEAVVGEPINITNGNVFREEKDVTISSSKGLPIEFVRSYNSFSLSSGSFGQSWRHSYECSLVEDTSTGNITLKEGSGRDLIFKYPPWDDTTDQYVNYIKPYGIFYNLKYNSDSSHYTLTKSDDTKWRFDSNGKLIYIADRNDNRITLSYSGDTLKTIANASGRRLILEYNSSGNIDTLKDGSGRVLVTYSGNKVIRHISASEADTTEYTYSMSSNDYKLLTKIRNSDGGEYNYEYSASDKWRVTKSYQKNNINEINIQYSKDYGGCPCWSTKTKVIDSDYDTTIYYSSWDPAKVRRQLAKVENSGCAECFTEFKYGANGKVVHKQYGDGVIDSLAYDWRGNASKEIRATNNSSLKQITEYTYLSDFHLPTLVKRTSVADTSEQAKIKYSYDSKGNLTSVKDSGMVDASNWYYDSTNYTYNSYGQLIKINGPRDDSTDVADSTVFTYDTLWHELASVTQYTSDTFLVTIYSEYDSLGNPQLIIGPDSVKTRYFYDGRGRTYKIINGSTLSNSTITQYAYNSYGSVTQIIRPNGDTIKYNYDSANRLASIVNGVNDSLKYTYDIESRLTKKQIVSSSGVVTWYENYEYDTQKDLLTKIIGPLNDTTFFSYDTVGNRTSKKDANGNSVDFRYDDLNRLTAVIQWEDGDSLKTIYTYDSMNNLKTVTDADDNVTSYKYSDKGLLTEDSSAVTGVTAYEYDKAGNLVKKKDSAGDSILYSYDALNRLTLIEFQDTTRNIKYLYDNSSSNRMGRLYKEKAPYDTITYSYKYTGLLGQEDKQIAGVTYTTKYSYDKNGNLTSMEYPTGRKLYYYYDKADQLDSLRTVKFRTTKRLITNMDHAPYGGPTSFTYGNGITTSIKYNQRYWVDSLATDTNIVRRKYKYDTVGNIINIDDLVYPAKSESLYYDDLNRLTFAVSDSFYSDTLSPARDTIRYLYSDAGNRLMKIEGYDATFYHYSSNNKLDSTTGYEPVIYRYDNKGNVIVDSTTAKDTLGYDQLNRLVSLSGTTEEQYYYDGEGKRIRKYSAGDQFVFLYDQWGNLIGERDIEGNLVCDYVWANGKLIAKIVPKGEVEPMGGEGEGMEGEGGGPPPIPPDSDKVFYYHLDHLGTPLVLTGTNRQLRWGTNYLPFGKTYGERSISVSNEVRLPGQYHDRNTKLYYNWHRYYNPSLGRYYQADPVGLRGRINLYVYVKNNPVNFSDPTGLKECCSEDSLKICNVQAARRWQSCVTLFSEALAYGVEPLLVGCVLSGEYAPPCILVVGAIMGLPTFLGYGTCFYNYFQDIKKCQQKYCQKH